MSLLFLRLQASPSSSSPLILPPLKPFHLSPLLRLKVCPPIRRQRTKPQALSLVEASSPEAPILEGRFCLCCYFGQRMDHWGLSRLASPADMGKQNSWGWSSSYSCVWRCRMRCCLLLESVSAMLWGGPSSWASETLWSSNGTLPHPMQLWVRSHDKRELDSHVGVSPWK